MRTPWCTSYFSLSPRRIEMVSSTEGSAPPAPAGSAAPGRHPFRCICGIPSGWWPPRSAGAAGQGRFEHVEASMEPSAAPAPTRVCISSMNRMTCPRLFDLLEHRLEAVLELAAVLGPGDQGAHVQGDHLPVLEPFGHVPGHDALGQPSTMAVLPTPGSPISTGLFLVRRRAPGRCGGSPRRGRSPGPACPLGIALFGGQSQSAFQNFMILYSEFVRAHLFQLLPLTGGL
jgi:hypothetical protein